MSVLARLTDRFVLCPSRHEIECEHLTPEKIPTPFGHIEAWHCSSGGSNKFDVVAIKFPGAGGRAERGSPHPLELWQGVSSRIWTVNHHGYGASSGSASLHKLAKTCEAVWRFIETQHPSKKVLLIGNSLGCISALYVAARFPVAGAYLRNPPPLGHLIRHRPRYNWWNFGLARYFADQVPAELDAVSNAARCNCPALFIQSEKDKVVPGHFQQMIFGNYAGPQKTFVIENARHHDRIPVHQEQEFLDAIRWLQNSVL